MSEVDLRSLRIIFDLQSCQTDGSSGRGVGRYSESLFKAIIRQSGARHIQGALSNQHKIFPAMKGVKPSQVVYANALPDITSTRFFAGGEQDRIDSILLTNFLMSLNPDVVHVSHIFEGFRDRVPIPTAHTRSGGQIFSATLYDLIPLRFPEIYFRDVEFEKWYLSRLEYYRHADLLLSISESTRRDAIELLGIPPEKIVTVMGGVDEHFKPPVNPDETKAMLVKKYMLKRPGVVLYTGGDDHRKNLLGALKAYALMPSSVRQENQLVIICALEDHRKSYFLNEAKKIGLTNDEVYFLGFISEADLIAFYGTCDVFFFPSLYEGLGFPVIEAMSCGAPTISGDNSSLCELVGRKDATFDSSSIESIASRLEAVLDNKIYANKLRQHGLERAKLFNWKSTATKALAAFDGALIEKRSAFTRAAAAGVLPKFRMALLTPLPPTRSGIADYNAQFLPYLSKYFNIDIYSEGGQCDDRSIVSSFRIFEAESFRKNASLYDVIFYEIGNSEFHAFMLPLIEEFPGVVGLHDAYLSGLMGYLQFNLNQNNSFFKAMLSSHGSVARGLLAPVRKNADSIGNAIVNLPCSKAVIENAVGIISHSKFNLDLAREFYPEGWAPPYRIIPQMVKIGEKNTDKIRAQERKKLDFDQDDFVITTFGHIAWTKWGDKILQAFLGSSLSQNPKCKLVFAGSLSEDNFGVELENAVKKSGISHRIRITGYLEKGFYNSYLKASDIAIQLRTNSRGGTPKGVLDCLSVGLPVIVNDAASYKDYPRNSVFKLPPEPTIAEVGICFERLLGDNRLREKLADSGYAYVKENHRPEDVAAQYASAIHEFVSREKSKQPNTLVDSIAPHLAGANIPTESFGEIAKAICSYPRVTFSKSRLLIDCSYISKKDHGTGIQRVVKELVREAYCSPRHGFEAVSVQLDNDHLVSNKNWLAQQQLLLPFEESGEDKVLVGLNRGDNLLMLDSSWDDYQNFAPVFKDARENNVPVITVVYDLLPIRLPEGNFVEGGKVWFENWLRSAIRESDGLVCISKAVADDLISYIEENRLERPFLKVGWWHLGFTQLLESDSVISSTVRGAALNPFCLMVGTIEPRKNHALALDAFEKLWASGIEVDLVLAGSTGWMVDEFIERVVSHQEYGKRLHFIARPTDSELGYLYKQALMLLALSKGEGFGLPIIESSYYETPVACSKIPSFEELGGDNVLYVDIQSAGNLSSDLKRCFELIGNGFTPTYHKISRLSWGQSLEQLLHVVVDQNWYKIYP